MLQKKVPSYSTGNQVERNKYDDEDKEFKIDLGQITKNFFPFNAPEKEIEEYEGQEEDYSKTNPGFFHNKPSILSS